ncbi:MAG: alpha/beta hydrolase [Myxococcota bacterium]
MEPQSIRIPGADGLTLHGLEWSTEGVPLLLLHGFGNEAHFWDDLAPALAPHYRTLALDLRGHGDSDHDPEGRYDHLSMARDLEAVTEALGLERVVLVGHSLGGRVALRFVGRNADRMAGLILVDSGPDLDARGTTRIQMETGRRSPTFESIGEYEALLVQLYPAGRPETLARLARTGVRQREDGRYEQKLDTGFARRRGEVSEEQLRTWAEAESKALWDTLLRAPCPTLVVRGAASDVLSAETADRMAETASQGSRVEVERAGHSVMIDNPDRLRQVVTDFVLG